ncbi:MAG: ribosome-binding factor A [Acidiferrobacteraceae bacterium]|nr:ribosome-binding factor A [Acidiferrobacteraceae bacterium]|tara:strand:+ start:1346 stop:1711 length:366 start_codon:yes stop_codon:yes gene_type:complete
MQRIDRSRRVAEVIRRELAQLVQVNKVTSGSSSLLSITAVELTRDLKQATVFFTLLGEAEHSENTLSNLKENASKLRYELSQRLNLRHTPLLTFRHDESIERGVYMSQLIDSLSSAKEEHS